MLHKMKLLAQPFEKIKSGQKIIEIRLNDQKRQKIKVGDQIEFFKLPELEDKVIVEVVELLKYNTFSELIDNQPIEFFGYKEEDKDYLKQSIYQIYTLEQEAKFGVLGIKIKLIEK